MSRKAFTVAVVATTIAWSIGLSALLAPLSASAAASGTLVKASLPAVYYVGSDGKRYVFPNEKTYKTWYANFSTVQTITDAELAAMAIGGNVTYKPGVRMVKITTDPKVYAVDAHGTLRWVSSEAVAVALYGASWNQMIDDVPDAFFTNYVVGSDVASASSFSPSGVGAAASSINVDKSLSNTTATGALSAMLSASQPLGATLPRNATGVTMLKVDVKNGSSSAVTVDSLTVKRTGPGASTDLANVYVYDGNTRLTTGRTINSSTNDASFSGLNLALAAGETKTLTFTADMGNAGTGNVDQLGLVALSAGTVASTGLPLSGPSFTLAGASVGSMTVTKSGAQPLSNVKLGGKGQKIAEFKIAAGSDEDISLQKIALREAGAVTKTNITNLVLKQAGLTIATAAGIDSKDRVTFVLSSPMLLEKGSSRTFEVFADIASNARVGAAETILSYVDQKTDVLAIGSTYGFGVMVDIGTAGTYDGAGCILAGGNCSGTRIEGGQLTITFNGPAAKDVAVNGKDVELYNFTMVGQANLEVRNLRMQIAAGNVAGVTDGLIDTTPTAVANYSDIKVTDTATGAVIAGPLSLLTAGSDTLQALLFTEVFNLAPGVSRTFKVSADIRNNTAVNFDGDTVRIDLLPFAAADIRNLDNSTDVVLTDIVPNSGIVGNNDTVRVPTLTVSKASTPVAQTFIQGSQGVQLAAFSLKAGDASEMRVSSLTIQGLIDSDDGATCTVAPDAAFNLGQETAACASLASLVSTAKLMNGATQLGDTKSPSTSTAVGNGGVLTFDNLNLVIAKGQSVTLTLVGTLSGGQTLVNMPDDIAFEVLNAASLSVTDTDGNTVTAAAAAFPVLGPTMRIAGAGTLSLALGADDTESEAGLLVGGASNAVLGKYKFTAQNEELKLGKARFRVQTSTAASTLSLYDGSTLVGGPTAVDGAGNADFTSVNFVIPKDASKTLTVKANLNSVGSGGSNLGDAVTVTLRNDATTFEVRGTSAGSSTLITTVPGGNVSAKVKLMAKTKPTVSLVALPSSTLDAGDKVAMRFTVAADAAGDVSLKAVTFKLSKTTLITVAGTGASSIRRVGDGSNLAGNFALDGACNAAATSCTLYVDFGATGEEVIAAGTSRTYDLRLTLGAIPSGAASVSVNLDNDAAAEYGNVTAATGPALAKITTDPGVFVWSDNSLVGHSATYGTSTADWATGKYIKVLPTDAQTMSK